jgi:outer membrane protein OmpA-like peptidoglycan-associated protein
MAIVDSIMNLLTPQVTSAFADKLGVSTGEVQTGVGASVAAILSGIVDRSSDHSFVAEVFYLVKSVPTAGVLNTLSDLASGLDIPSAVENQVSKLTSLVFGDRLRVEEAIALRSGLTAGSGHEVMGLAGTLTAGYLGRLIRDSGLSVGSFTEALRSEASHIRSMMPAGLSIGSPAVASAGSAAAAAANKRGNSLPWVLIGAALLGLLIFLLVRGCGWQKPLETPSEESAPSPAATTSLGAFGSRTLPGGTVLNIPANGMENKLLDFINDASRPVDKTTWFDFDRLTFDTGKATLQPSSAEQLQNIAAILKAYPNVKVKVGGYTDNTGDAKANLTLSQQRADNVMHEFVQRGIDRTRLEAEGYGEDHPVADNTTPEGRQKNRRISLRVTAK